MLAGSSAEDEDVPVDLTGPVIIMNVYRPESAERPQTQFYEQLATVLEDLVVYVGEHVGEVAVTCERLITGESSF